LPPAPPQRRLRWLNARRFQFSIGSACPPSFGQGEEHGWNAVTRIPPVRLAFRSSARC
jgi:hypothetical protein